MPPPFIAQFCQESHAARIDHFGVSPVAFFSSYCGAARKVRGYRARDPQGSVLCRPALGRAGDRIQGVSPGEPSLTQSFLLQALEQISALDSKIGVVQGQNNLIIAEQRTAAERRRLVHEKINRIDVIDGTLERIEPSVDQARGEAQSGGRRSLVGKNLMGSRRRRAHFDDRRQTRDRTASMNIFNVMPWSPLALLVFLAVLVCLATWLLKSGILISAAPGAWRSSRKQSAPAQTTSADDRFV
jgi:hypothetical protein